MIDYALFQKKLLEKVRPYGLSMGQPKILDYLKDHNGASQKEIAAACQIEAGSLTSVLNRMEEKGMVQRKMLHGDRRTYHIFLTPFGEEQKNMWSRRSKSWNNRPFSALRRKNAKRAGN